VRGDIGWIPILLVVGREAGIQVYRSLAGRRGISLPARQLGKWKTTLQFAAVGVFLFPPVDDLPWLQQTVLWVAVALTLLSALDMLRRGWQESRA
jgi:CDP-diacylglycerol--glycerol-3-phosphate 3-phosphatidyltransferase